MKALSPALYRWRRLFNHYLPPKGAMGRFVELTIRKTSDTKIGNNFRVATCGVIRSYEGAKLTIGENFQSNNFLMLICRSKMTIGRDVTIGPNVCLVDFNHDYNHENLRDNYINGSIEIGNNVWIGAGVVVLPNSKIGDNCVIGAGSVVMGDIPAGTIYFNPREKFFKSINPNKGDK